MKITLILFTILASITTSFPQKGIVFHEPGMVFINDLDSVQGTITFSYAESNLVHWEFYDTAATYRASQINGFRLDSSRLYFIPAKYDVAIKAFFQVVTPKNKKLKLIKTYVPGMLMEPGSYAPGSWRLSIYVAFERLPFSDLSELAKHLMDRCPVLAEKIQKKQKGYKLNIFLNDDEKLAVYRRIVDEGEEGCRWP